MIFEQDKMGNNSSGVIIKNLDATYSVTVSYCEDNAKKTVRSIGEYYIHGDRDVPINIIVRDENNKIITSLEYYPRYDGYELITINIRKIVIGRHGGYTIEKMKRRGSGNRRSGEIIGELVTSN